jgi:hypothetical protein
MRDFNLDIGITVEKVERGYIIRIASEERHLQGRTIVTVGDDDFADQLRKVAREQANRVIAHHVTGLAKRNDL